MARRDKSRPDYQRLAIAEEAARLMQEHGVRDFRSAKAKAVERLGLAQRGALPSNAEVDAALAGRNRIFRDAEQEQLLAELRGAAIRLMRELAGFGPRLVGAVLNGNATDTSAIELHLFSDAAEAVAEDLQALGLAARPIEQRLRTRHDVLQPFPGYRVRRDGFEYVLTVFPERGRGNAPLSPVDGRPMRRATVGDVEALLAAP